MTKRLTDAEKDTDSKASATINETTRITLKVVLQAMFFVVLIGVAWAELRNEVRQLRFKVEYHLTTCRLWSEQDDLRCMKQFAQENNLSWTPCFDIEAERGLP